MYLEEILEVAIGLIFIYMLLSLACMQIQEWGAGIFRTRGKHLAAAIGNMLDPAGLAHITASLYNTHRIRSLSRPSRDANSPRLPSYIPSDAFASALLVVFQQGGRTPQAYADILTSFLAAPPQALSTALKKELSGLEAQIGDLNLQEIEQRLSLITAGHPDIRKAILSAVNLHALRLGIETSASRELRSVMTGIIETAETFLKDGDTVLEQVSTQVETWFNQSMDRATGWYRRRSQIISIVIALFLVPLLNVDTISIAESLWREPALRAALIANAEKFELPDEGTIAEDPEAIVRQFQGYFSGLDFPFGWQQSDPEGPCGLFNAKFLMAWVKYLGIEDNGKCVVPIDQPQDSLEVWSKIFGWIVSAVAVSQGAPFWFDTLKKVINIRSSGANPAAAAPQAKKS